MLPVSAVLRSRDPRFPVDPAALAGAAFTTGITTAVDRHEAPRRTELLKKRRDRAAGLPQRAAFDPDQTLRIFLRDLLRARVRKMLSCAGKAAASGDADVLHRLRVSARRLQAYLRVFQSCFPNRKYKVYARILRKLLKA